MISWLVDVYIDKASLAHALLVPNFHGVLARRQLLVARED